ncbi:hypothetical protein [Butyrivibrio sp. AE3004]|uniref:hypothetical protein n=1 Tax=Butyrivibrio sp. AE3004 TaxID=1506994 RepID=UPI000494253D|nr:hypothetical protein [Butyrivibrio sp. AE3004]
MMDILDKLTKTICFISKKNRPSLEREDFYLIISEYSDLSLEERQKLMIAFETYKIDATKNDIDEFIRKMKEA